MIGILIGLLFKKLQVMKKQKLFPIIISAVALVSTVSITSCNKDDADGPTDSAHINMYLTDAPAEYDAVYIDVQSVEITSDQGVTTHALINPGVYDLLKLNSGADTLMISEDLTPRTASKIRLILGDNNSVVEAGVTHPLAKPDDDSPGLVIEREYKFESRQNYDMWMDFDAGQSIDKDGAGNYSLNPVLRIYTDEESGAISGHILPLGAAFNVSVVSATGTYGTTINNDGTFYIGGLTTGTYDLKFTAVIGFLDITISDVSVTNGSVTEVGEIVIPL